MLYTSRYHNAKGIIESGAVAVGFTVGKPRWELPYPVEYLDELAPDGRALLQYRNGAMTAEAFSAAYRRKLAALGARRIAGMFDSIMRRHRNNRLALLCYEDLRKPDEFCHRSVFAQWWLEQTGEPVEELEPLWTPQMAQPATDESLVARLVAEPSPAPQKPQLTLF